LRGKPHLAVAVDTPARGGLAQLHHLAAQLLVEGVQMDLAELCAPAKDEAGPVSSTSRPLKMGLQPMSLGDFQPKPKPKAARPPEQDGDTAPAAKPNSGNAAGE